VTFAGWRAEGRCTLWTRPENDQFVEELLLAGERVPAGTYRQTGTARVVVMDGEGLLPASFDGTVACYLREPARWEQKPDREGDKAA
jgi:hypothetical protein